MLKNKITIKKNQQKSLAKEKDSNKSKIKPQINKTTKKTIVMRF